MKNIIKYTLVSIGILGFIVMLIGFAFKKIDEELGLKISLVGFGTFIIIFIIGRIFNWHK